MSIILCRATSFSTEARNLSRFFSNSARVPLHSFDAFDENLHPSIANMSLPISFNSSQYSRTPTKRSIIAGPSSRMNCAIVVKCGREFAERAIMTTFSWHSASMSLLEKMPRA